MSSRVFQSVIVQMKEATDRVIGVIDADSNVISCSDTSLIGEKWPEAVIKLNSAPDSVVEVQEGKYHQVRRMLASRGLPVTYLRREAEGRLTLGDLPLGQTKELNIVEAEQLLLNIL